MQDKQDTPNPQPKTVDEFSEMPKVDEFKQLDPATKKALVEKFSTTEMDTEIEESVEEQEQVQEDEESEEQEPESKETPESEESEKSESDTQDKEQSEKIDWEKRYKDLQSYSTKKEQKLKEEYEDRIARLESVFEQGAKKETPAEKRSRFDALIEKNPKAKEFLEDLREGVKEMLGESVQPVVEKINHKEAQTNEQVFRGQLKEFLESDLGALESEMEQLVSQKFGSERKLLEAARKDPSLFDTLKAEVISRNFDKAVEIRAKKNTEDPKKRHEEIKKAGVSGKSKTSGPVESDNVDLENFKKLRTSEDKKKILAKQGLLDKSAMTSREWKK